MSAVSISNLVVFWICTRTYHISLDLPHTGKLAHTNKNPFRRPIPDEVRSELEEAFSNELEFYRFCVQRLENQITHLRRQKAEDVDDYDYFDYDSMEPYKEDFETEDYVLLV